MKLKFHISTAGIAGDPHKLLVGVDSEDNTYYAMFNRYSIIPFWSLMSLRLAKRRIIKEFQILRL